jgi:hypothetical protein
MHVWTTVGSVDPSVTKSLALIGALKAHYNFLTGSFTIILCQGIFCELVRVS